MANSSASTRSCPLCGLNATVIPDGRFGSRVNCRRCGRFDVELDGLAGIKQEQRYMLSAVSRDWSESGRTEVLTITQANVETLIERAPRPSVAERLNKILELTAQRTVGIGSLSTLTIELDYPLVAVGNPDEMRSLVLALEKRGLLWTERAALTDSIGLTVPGWERLEEIRRSGPSTSLVFVAMYFHTSTQALYDHGIKRAIRKAGYEPLRIDQYEHVNRIDDEIIGQVRRSRFMVADFTGQRHGVYFEAGFMMGLGRNVIWMCDKKELPNLHFDVRQYNFIDWESVEDARGRLLNRILRLEGEGPNVRETDEA